MDWWDLGTNAEAGPVALKGQTAVVVRSKHLMGSPRCDHAWVWVTVSVVYTRLDHRERWRGFGDKGGGRRAI